MVSQMRYLTLPKHEKKLVEKKEVISCCHTVVQQSWEKSVSCSKKSHSTIKKVKLELVIICVTLFICYVLQQYHCFTRSTLMGLGGLFRSLRITNGFSMDYSAGDCGGKLTQQIQSLIEELGNQIARLHYISLLNFYTIIFEFFALIMFRNKGP